MDDNQDKSLIRYYSQRAIGLATFIGGPLAAGVLIRRNFITLGKDKYGNYALTISILSVILLIAGLFYISEHILDQIPSPLIPALYVGLTYIIVGRIQGKKLKNHKEEKGRFYSVWRAAGIGLLQLIVYMSFILAYVYLTRDDFDTTKYENGMVEFQENDEKALELFSLPEELNELRTLGFINNIGIAALESNLELLDKLDEIEGLPDELKARNNILREYCKLRIETYQLIEQRITQNTLIYDAQINDINLEIKMTLHKL